MDLPQLAARHGFSESAVTVAIDALRRGGGIAQFDHPEFGGHGQWMPGMIMIGRMGDDALKTRVSALFSGLAGIVTSAPIPAPSTNFDAPAEWGPPATSGGQNNHRYAWYPRVARLVVEQNGNRSIYDTGEHRITGVSQDQSSRSPGRLVFTSQLGPVAVDQLRRVE